MSGSFVLLGLAICFVWLPDLSVRRYFLPPWLPTFLAAVIVGVASGVLAWTALASLAALGGAAWGSLRASNAIARRTLTAAAAAIALALALHLLPGFDNPKLFDGLRLSAGAAPFTQYLNFDKGAAGLVLLAAYAPRITVWSEARRALAVTLAVTAGTAAAVIGAALFTGYVRPDLKLPPLTPAFLATNLLFTCIPEEAFFRGLLQERLACFLARQPHWRCWLPVLISGLLFGVAHAAGGVTFAVLATLAGFGYSIAYAITRRIEAAVLTHFAVNALQFVGFTYPYLAR